VRAAFTLSSSLDPGPPKHGGEVGETATVVIRTANERGILEVAFRLGLHRAQGRARGRHTVVDQGLSHPVEVGVDENATGIKERGFNHGPILARDHTPGRAANI
jgi:hypothetical protein